jgi:glucosylceramidase
VEPTTRRSLLKLTAAAGLASAQPAPARATVRVTSPGSPYQTAPPLRWRPARSASADSIVLDPAQTYQEILGFGSSFTDSACYLLNQLPGEIREKLLHELFHQSEMGLGVARLCIGSSDYAAHLYSFDEGEPDPELTRFSIDHDKAYILPVLRQTREINPDLFLLGSPWSPPGWMKAGGSMLGGSMRKRYYAPYARYFVKFLEAYAAEGVKVNAVTVQNEVDTDQDGRMPACLWGQEYEMEFVAGHLGPQFDQAGLETRIWILDHNYNLAGRAIAELDDPRVARYVDGVAWHGYAGHARAMTRVHEAHPTKHMYWTEGGSDYNDPRYLTNWSHWGSTFTGILRNWSRCIISWNLALDEKGRPNIGPFSCGGMLTIHSAAEEITRSGLYWAMAHFSRSIRRGARRIESHGNFEGISHVAFRNPDGSTVAVITNSAASGQKQLVRIGASETEANLPADSITTVTW